MKRCMGLAVWFVGSSLFCTVGAEPSRRGMQFSYDSESERIVSAFCAAMKDPEIRAAYRASMEASRTLLAALCDRAASGMGDNERARLSRVLGSLIELFGLGMLQASGNMGDEFSAQFHEKVQGWTRDVLPLLGAAGAALQDEGNKGDFLGFLQDALALYQEAQRRFARE